MPTLATSIACIVPQGNNHVERASSPMIKIDKIRLPLLILCLCFVHAETPARSETARQDLEPVDRVARDAMAGCLDALDARQAAETFEHGLCIGVIRGLHYLSKDVCVPPAIGLDEIAGVVVRFLKTHPGSATQDFREVVLQAMRSAWPCAGQRGA